MILLSQLNTRQKILIPLLTVVFIILIWQIYGLWHGHADLPPARPLTSPTFSATAAGHSVVAVPPTPTASPKPTAINPATTSQAEYLRLVNEYQVVQLRRMIAESDEAIAVARRNAAKATAETAELSGDSSALTANSSADNNATASNTYVLVYTGQEANGDWTATLKKGRQTYDVALGTQLPDGSRINSIDEENVVLMQGSNKIIVGFSGQSEAKTAADESESDKGGHTTAKKPVVDKNAPTTAAVNHQVSAHAQLPSPVTKSPVAAALKPAAAENDADVLSRAIVTAQENIATVSANAHATGEKQTSEPATTVVNNANNSSAAEQLLQAPANHYTLQLASFRSAANATALLKQHGLQDKGYYYPVFSKQGGKFYVVVYGDYANLVEAQTALKTLAYFAKTGQAFAVPMRQVQTFIKRSQST